MYIGLPPTTGRVAAARVITPLPAPSVGRALREGVSQGNVQMPLHESGVSGSGVSGSGVSEWVSG